MPVELSFFILVESESYPFDLASCRWEGVSLQFGRGIEPNGVGVREIGVSVTRRCVSLRVQGPLSVGLKQ